MMDLSSTGSIKYRCPVCVLISIYLKNSSKVSLDICYLLFLLDNDVQTALVLVGWEVMVGTRELLLVTAQCVQRAVVCWWSAGLTSISGVSASLCLGNGGVLGGWGMYVLSTYFIFYLHTGSGYVDFNSSNFNDIEYEYFRMFPHDHV